MDTIWRPAPLRLGRAPGHAAQLYPARQPLGVEGRALLLWLHGGRFIGDDAEVSQARLAQLSAAGADVVALDYPLAPAHRFPAALQAAFQALQALAAEPHRFTPHARTALFVGGEEAGGNLAAALCMMARDQQAPVLAGQVLISPMLDPRLGSASMRGGACGGCECPYAQGWKAYLGDGIHADHPYALPLHARRLGELAPALVLSQPGHPLSDESRRYAAALRRHGSGVQDVSLTQLGGDEASQILRAFLRSATRRARSRPA